MRSRKRVISLVLGLVLILGSAVGPFAMSGVVADDGDISATATLSANEVVENGTVTLTGALQIEHAEGAEETWPEGLEETFEIQAIFKEKPSAGGDSSEISETGNVTKTNKTYSITINVGSNAGKRFELDKIEFTSVPTKPIILSSKPAFEVKPVDSAPIINSISINDDNGDNISLEYTENAKAKISVTFSDISKIKEGSVNAQVKKNSVNEGSPVSLTKDTENGKYEGQIDVPSTAGSDYSIEITAKYGDGEEKAVNPLSKSFAVTISEGNPAEPTISNATLEGKTDNIEFTKSTNQTSPVVVEFSDNTKTYTVSGKIMKKGDSDAYTEYAPGGSANTITIAKSTGGDSYTGTMPVPSETGNYRLDITATYDTDKTLSKQILFNVKDGSQGNPAGTLSFLEVKFTNYTEKNVNVVEESTLSLSVKVTSTLSNDNITVKANIDTIGEHDLLKGDDGTYTYSFVVPKYKANGENFYGMAISATSPNSTSPELNRDLSFTVTPKPIDTELKLKRELSSNSLVGNSSGQIFTEGGTIKFTITSENPNVRFTNSKIVAWITTNSNTPKTSVTLNKITTGTYANRRYEGTFTAGVPLASDFYYTITNEAFPYTITGGTDGTATEFPVAYTTASNKPYIRSGNLNATYYSSANSNIGVSPGSLIEGNVITYQAQLDNYSGVNSVNMEFTNRSGMTGYNINIPLSKVNNTGLFRGSYTVTRNNTGFTYDLSKITYKTSSGSVSYDMDNYPTYGHAFTISNHQHTFGGAYQYSSEEHWQNSTCNAEHPGQIITGNRAKHTYTSTIVTSATQTTSGTRKYTCTVCGYTYNATIPATGTALSTTTLDIIRNMSNGTRAIVTFNSDYVVSSDIFSALKGTTKEIEFQNRNKVSWIFRGQDITGTAKAININTEISSAQSNTSPYASYIRNLVGKQPTVIIDFAANGNLPGRATVRVPLSTAMLNALGNNRTGLKVQYYNATANRLEDIAANVNVYGSGSDSYVEFAITHNSSYIITKEGGQNVDGGTTGNGNTNSGNTNVNSGNKKPTSTTVTTVQKVIHKVSPKTLDGGYGMIWISMFMVGVLLVISSLCMTKFEE